MGVLGVDSFAMISKSTDLVNKTGGVILIAGAALAIVNGFLGALNALFGLNIALVFNTVDKRDVSKRSTRATLSKVRLQLGEITAFGLEILVVSDILETLNEPIQAFSFSLLGKIAAIASFRTFLAFVLSQETEEIRREISHQEEEAAKIHKRGSGGGGRSGMYKLPTAVHIGGALPNLPPSPPSI